MEPRICVFKVAIVSAANVWSASAGKEGCKAAVSLHFPGQDAANLYQSDAVLPSPPAQDNAISITDAIQPDNAKTSQKDQNPSAPSAALASFSLKAFSDYVRASDWLLWHQLVTEPLLVSLLWISSSSQTVTAVGRVSVDLSELMFSKDLYWERECMLEPVNAAEQEVASSKKDTPLKAPSKLKKTNAMDEVPPLLSQGASLKLQITLDTPIFSQYERDEGILLEFSKFCVERVPPQYAENNAFAANYSLAFEVPGFSGTWWSSFSAVKQDVKQSLGVARIHGGVVTFISAEPNGDQVKATPLTAAISEGAADSGKAESLSALATITWNASLRRFLPGAAARELKESIWKKQTWHGEIARYSTADQPIQSALPFERDHLSVNLNLCSLLEEGIVETRICSALVLYTSNQALLTEKDAVYSGSKINNDKDSSNVICPWQACSSQLTICIKTNRPLQPTWVAPPKPPLTFQDVLTVRPKLPNSLDKLEIAVGEFRDLIYVGAQSIFLLQEKIVSGDTQKIMSQTAVWADRWSD